MAWLIGIDEAGYGPNLGPLSVGATAWHVEQRGARSERRGTGCERRSNVGGLALAETDMSIDLYQRLADVVSPKPDGQRIAIADSKQLYKPASHSKSNGGLRHLERGVLTALATCGRPIADWQTLLTPPPLPWYAGYNCELPIDTTPTELTELAGRFSKTCEAAAVQLVDLQTRLVDPEEFNRLTEHHGTKGAALSHISIELLKSILANLPATHDPLPTFITCDKHGGRNRYGALLQHHFPDHWIETLTESRPRSHYRWGPAEERVKICFRTKGEAELPVALASMTAKYHRELAMRAFNAFWTAQLPGLRPTAGYPQDAKRFKAEIAAVQSKLRIDDSVLWRNR